MAIVPTVIYYKGFKMAIMADGDVYLKLGEYDGEFFEQADEAIRFAQSLLDESGCADYDELLAMSEALGA